tara:strand:+ start:730 stop:900 length:171 start_codon:yes stop_codon:yes gene_type:complete
MRDTLKEELTRLVKHDFCDDKDKMIDFNELTKEEFLSSYSYITEEEYNLTRMKQNS